MSTYGQLSKIALDIKSYQINIKDFSIKDFVNFTADACAILTAIIAIWFSIRVKFGEFDRLSKLEKYLKAKRDASNEKDKGQRSILHIMARVGLSEEEVLRAIFQRKHIRCLLKSDHDGYASSILLWYE